MFPYGDVGIALFSGDGGVKSASINFGVWNSLHTGSSGTDGFQRTRALRRRFLRDALARACGSDDRWRDVHGVHEPEPCRFGTVKEVLFKVSQASKFAPYRAGGVRARAGQADGCSNKGTYAEFGVGPSWPLGGGKATLAIPVKVGLSLKDYYEGADGDEKFGYVDVGALVTVPLTGVPATSVRGMSMAASIFSASATRPKPFNKGDAGQVMSWAASGSGTRQGQALGWQVSYAGLSRPRR